MAILTKAAQVVGSSIASAARAAMSPAQQVQKGLSNLVLNPVSRGAQAVAQSKLTQTMGSIVGKAGRGGYIVAQTAADHAGAAVLNELQKDRQFIWGSQMGPIIPHKPLVDRTIAKKGKSAGAASPGNFRPDLGY